MNIKPFVIGALGVVGHDFRRPSKPESGSGTLTESNTASQAATTSTSSLAHNDQIVKDHGRHAYQRHIELLTKRKTRSRKQVQAEEDDIEMEERVYRIIYLDFLPTDNQSTIQRRPNSLF